MRKSLIKVIKTNWQQEATLGKAAYCIVAFLAFWMCFEGVILESLNIHILGFYGIWGIYWISLITCAISRKWKLFLVTLIGFYVLYGVLILSSEILYYYLLKWFNLDISYR